MIDQRSEKDMRSSFRVLAIAAIVSLYPLTAVAGTKPITPSCGDTIGPGGNWSLTSDIGPCAQGDAPALTLIGPVRLDMNGFRLLCAVQDGEIGIQLQGKGAQLRNGTVESCDTGVELGGAGRHKVSGVVASTPSEVGFDVISDRNILLGNRVGGLSDTVGFDVDGNENRLSRNVAADTQDGFMVGGDRNQLDRNLVERAGFVSFSINGHDNVFRRNTAVRSHFESYYVRESGNRLIRNEAREFRRLAFRVNAEDNLLLGNRALEPGTDDWCIFEIRGSSHSIRRNHAEGREPFCILGENHEVSSNEAVTKSLGFRIDGTNHRILRNRSRADSSAEAARLAVGFHVSGENHILEGNLATDHGRSGFWVHETARGHFLERNTGRNNNRGSEQPGGEPGHYDARDDNAGCGSNRWANNRFGTVSQGCIQ